MTSTAESPAGSVADARNQFLEVYEREHQTTMRVLRAYPADKLDLQPHPKSKTARDLAWIFVLERGLGMAVWQDAFAEGPPAGAAPEAPESMEQILAALEKAHRDFAEVVRDTSDEDLMKTAKFFVAPQKMGDVPRLDFAWFLLHDQIHHRGQMSVYLRMAGGKVPSIYGPTADEPWM
jgi:uncharacterized damage-inducible protein DinB